MIVSFCFVFIYLENGIDLLEDPLDELGMFVCLPREGFCAL